MSVCNILRCLKIGFVSIALLSSWNARADDEQPIVDEPISEIAEGREFCLTDLEVYAGVDDVQIIWANAGAPSYKIYRSDNGGAEYQVIQEVAGVYGIDPQYQDTQVITGNTYHYAVTVVNENGVETCQSPIVIVIPKERVGNKPPWILSSPIETAIVGEAYLYAVDAVDYQGDAIRYAMKVAPQGMSVDPDEGEITWVPTHEQIGSHYVTVRVVDDAGEFDQQSYYVTVTEPTNQNHSPVIQSTPVTSGAEHQAYSYSLSASDPDAGDVLSFELTQAPQGMVIDAETGQVDWLPEFGTAGTYEVSITVHDLAGLSDTQTYQLVIAQTNRAPHILSAPVLAGTENVQYAYAVSVEDPDVGDTLNFALTTAPQGMTIDPASGLIEWLPPMGMAGIHDVTVQVSDPGGLSDTQVYQLTVAQGNLPPRIDSTPITTGVENDPYTYSVVAVDPNPGDTLGFELVTAPQGMTIDSATGLIEWLPVAGTAGVHDVVIRVSDQNGLTDTQTCQLTISPENRAPTITSTPGISATVGQLYEYDVDASDPDTGDALNFTLTLAPDGMTIDSVDGLIHWSPDVAQIGDHPVTLAVNDIAGLSATQSFTVSVISANAAPLITSTPVNTAVEGSAYQYDVEAQDADGDTLTYALALAPQGMTIDPATGVIDWVPDETFSMGSLMANAYCRIPASDEQQRPRAVDAVMVVDGSGSNKDSWPWVANAMATLDMDLQLNGVGADPERNRYGLVGFGTSPASKTFDGNLFGAVSDLYEVTYDGISPGGSGSAENGLRALQFAIDSYPFRSDVVRNLIWIPDEPQQGVLQNDESLEDFTQRLIDGRYNVNVVTNLQLQCVSDGQAVLGVDAEGRGYVADGADGFDYCEVDLASFDEAAEWYRTGYVEPFILPALATGGGAWSITALRDPAQAESLRKALTSRMFRTSIVNEAERGLADIAVQGVTLHETSDGAKRVEVSLLNRGAREITTPIAVNLADSSHPDILLASQSVSGLAAGAVQTISLAIGAVDLTGNISVELGVEDAIECLTDNNQTEIPVVRVAVSDNQGNSASQTFSILVQDINQPPVISSTPELTASVGQPYTYQVVIEDPDQGDDHRFTLTGNAHAAIDPDTGLMIFTPDSTDLGEQSFTINAMDLASASDTQTFVLNVNGDYLAPRFDGPPDNLRAVIHETYTFSPSVTADSTAVLSFSLLESPTGMSIDPVDGRISWVPDETDINRLRLVTMLVADQYGNQDGLVFMVFGDEPNQAPVITTDPVNRAILNQNYIYLLRYEDPNVREDFDLQIDTTASGLAAVIYQTNGLDNQSARMSWRQGIVSASYPAHLSTSDYLCKNPAIEHPSAALPFTERWNARATFVGRHLLAAPVTDTDGDGQVNVHDRSAILMTYAAGASTYLRAYDSLTGEVYWTHEFNGLDVRPSQYIVPAIADINADGVPDILLVESASQLLIAISSDDRRELWRSTVPVSARSASRSEITVTDLQGDGLPEIAVGNTLYDYQGNALLNFSLPVHNSTYFPIGSIYALDWDSDNRKELIRNGVVYNMDGSVVFRPPFADGHDTMLGYSAFANFDADPEPEMVLVERSDGTDGSASVSLLDHDGSFIWGPNSLEFVGQPIVGDMDADGELEIFVSGEDVLLDHLGQEQWRLNGYSRHDGMTGVAADLQNDGRIEIIVHRLNGALILDALTGTEVGYTDTLHTESMAKPLLVDLDRDGKVEVVSAASSEISVVGYTGSQTNPNLPHAIYQSWWQPEGLNEQLAVNPELPNPWVAHNTDQIPVPSTRVFDVGLPDLWVDAPQGDQRQSVSVEVANRGTADYQGELDVELFAGDPQNGGVLLGTQTLSNLNIGERHTLTFTGLVPVDFVGELVARVVPRNGVQECQTNNNTSSAYTMDLTLSDHAGAVDTQNYLLGVEYNYASNSITTPVVPTATEGELFTLDYDILIRDYTDDNNSAFFYLRSGPEGLSVDADSGVVSWTPPYGSAGTQDVTISANHLSGLSSRFFRITVLPATNHPPVITSTPQTGSFAFQAFAYDVEAEDPEGDTLSYRLDQAPNGMTIDADSGLIAWTPDTNGDFPVTVVVSDGVLETTQTFTITVVLPNQSPEITSTPVMTVLQGQTYQYQLTATDPEDETITFGLVNSPTGMQIETATGLVTWTPGIDQLGVHSVEVTASDSNGNTSSQSYQLRVVTEEGNTAPRITSNPVGSAIFDQLYGYDLDAIDSDGDTLTYQLISAPSGMSIDPATGQISWIPSTSQSGSFDIHVRVEDGRGGYALQSYSLSVSDGSATNALPVIQSQPGTLARNGLEYRYSVQATDADGDSLSYSLTDAPSGMSVDGTAEITWAPTSEQTVSVTLRVSDGQGYVTQSWMIEVVPADAELNAQLAITPENVAEGDTVTLRVIPDNAVAPVSVSLTVDGSPVVLDESYQAQIQASGLGSHSVTATVTDAYATITENGSFLVRDPNSLAAPVVTLVSPADASEITAPTPVIATIEDDDLTAWELWLVPPSQATVDISQATLLASGSTVVNNQEIGQLDPTLLMNGQHRLYLRAVDAGGNEARDDSVVQVTGDMKLGHFSITFKDLEVPVAGIPITITRTYDSRRRNQSLDFGQGWSVGYQDVFVQESRPAGFNWFLDSYASGPLGVLTTYCVRPYGDNIVTVTMPDGDVERFRAVATPECNEAMPLLDVEIVFEALDGTDSTLEALNGNSGRLVNQHLVDPGEPGIPLDISRYRLTTREGQSYELEQGVGIRTLTVPSGDVLTFDENGITHSSGATVAFVRDAEGRIEQIQAPDGTHLTYVYNSDGDLTDYADQTDALTRYTYINDHYLEDIVDARGVRAIRNLYNSEGRLIGQIDAQGNQVDYSHDLSGRSQTVTDRRGNSRILVFNERGDIVAETNALGETHQRTYDAYGDELSHTDPLGNTTVSTYDTHGNQLTETDPLGRTKTWTYSWYNQMETETANDGRVTSFDYRNYIIRGGVRFDKAGPLIGLSDGLGNQTQLGYPVNGYQPVRLTDAEAQTTQYAYDTQGRMIRETAPDGSVTEYTHDAMGRILTETRTRTEAGTTLTEVTRHTYDAAGRRTSTADPLGQTTQTEYDAAGQVSAEIDALGNRTEYTYDDRGNQTQVLYPDGTTEGRVYDEENNLIAQTDRVGQTTRMVYDAANRLSETISPDSNYGSVTRRNEYDAAGRLIAEIDALGNRTEHAYDAVGQRISTTDALGHETRFEYDVHGNRVAMIDALNRRTEYVYDAADRLIETRYPDLSISRTTYDRVGRRTLGTDQATRSTQYGYDAQGRLVQVTDALGGITSYTYDEAGNKLTQTDAENRTTSWTYDSLGRVLSRTLPLGQQETFAYDANGNLVSHTDFNGQTTTHQYDSANRPIRSDYADGNREDFSYDEMGNRILAELTRPDGDVSTYYYGYDVANRLDTATLPDGTVLSYAYDRAGNRTQVRIDLPDGGTLTTDYAYDNLNRLQSVTDAAGTTGYGYDAVGNRTRVSYPNGSREVYQYDSLNRLIRKETYDGAGTLVGAYDYTLDPTGRRTEITEYSGRTTAYGYDDLYRLTTEQISDGQNGDYSASYQYDAVGNRTYSTVNGVQTAYSYDANDRLTQQGGTRYTYDANGNTLNESLDTDTVSYGYNAKNELVGVTQSGVTTEYDYNPNGIRTSKTEGGVTTGYVVDENRDYAQVLVEQDGANSIVYTYGDDLISQDRNGVASYYHYDGLGSTRSLTDQLGNLTDTYDYEAFGEVLNRTGSTENGYLFAGEQFDNTLSQYYLRARYYNPASGRFTQQDSWMGNNSDPITLHKYLYANADPANVTDPSGHFGLVSLGVANNIRMTLTNLQTEFGMNLLGAALDPDAAAAGPNFKGMGLGILAGSSGFRLARLLSSSVRKACNSFDGETLVYTLNGLIPIKDISIGDLVASYNEETGDTEYKEVTHLIQREGDYEIVDVMLSGGEVIEATSGHPFYAFNDDKKWLFAEDLNASISLLDYFGNTRKVESTSARTSRKKVYNLTVDETHTYYVGESGVLVHNMGKKGCRLPEIEASFSSIISARNHARNAAKLGGNAVPFVQQKGPYKNKLVTGMQSQDGKRGWRLDWDTRGSKGMHINWWIEEEGVLMRGANKIDGSSYDDYLRIIEHFPWL